MFAYSSDSKVLPPSQNVAIFRFSPSQTFSILTIDGKKT